MITPSLVPYFVDHFNIAYHIIVFSLFQLIQTRSGGIAHENIAMVFINNCNNHKAHVFNVLT